MTSTAPKLAIFVITYNRASRLEKTLAQLLESPFASCQITLLDNCSTDETPAVCARYAGLFVNMRVVRHVKNIGACANYLRAVELSALPYTWVLCDDDSFNWSDYADVLEAIENGEAGLISVGSPEQADWERGLHTTGPELLKRGARFFSVFTFMPGVIFKTELFNSANLAQAYRNIPNDWVHFGFIYDCFAKRVPIVISRKAIVHREGGSALPSRLHAFTSYVNNCRVLKNSALRRQVLYQCAPNRWEWFSGLAVAIAIEKVRYPEKVAREVADLAVGFSADQRVLLALLLPLIATPAPVFKQVRRALRRLKGKADEAPEAAFDGLRL